MKVDFIATREHYVDHLLPLWRELAPEERGCFFVPPELYPRLVAQGVPVNGELQRDVVVAASWPDIRGARAQMKVLMEHGVGQTYHESNFNPHYAGAPGRGSVDLFLAPNQRVLDLNKKATPLSMHELVGSPRMDRWFTTPGAPKDCVAISFHWRCRLVNECQSAFDHFKPAILPLSKSVRLVGHSHPTLWNEASGWYHRNGINHLRHFESIINLCSVYICDNSSTIYEFAALDRPVVVLNSPAYRRNLNHGLRFWEYADVGIQCNDPIDLVRCVDKAREDPPEVAERRREITEALFPVRDGTASARAAEAIRKNYVL